jgi:Developmentally Regulated MAPK Interacting Protein.
MRIAGSIILLGLLALCLSCDNGSNPATPSKPLEIIQPKGGESYTVGQTVDIKWRINDLTKISSVMVKLSTNNGKTFPVVLVGSLSIPPDSTSVSWTPLSDQVSTQCIVKVYEYNNESTIYDKSGIFTVGN